MSDTPRLPHTAIWHDKLVAGFRRTTEKLGGNLSGLLTKEKLDRETLDEIEEALIASDLGPVTAARIRERLEDERYDKGIDEAGIRQIVADEVAKVLRKVAKPLEIEAFPRPQVILVIGVNGSGKTTTIAKLAHLLQEQDYQVMLVAGDTFRAAAIGQLKVWAERIGVPIISGKEGGDAASLVWEGVKQGTAIGTDVLIVDTAGRLQNKAGLMDELSKIRRVLGRLNPAAPHDVVLVLDATTGQNALSQIEVFGRDAGVTGLVMTKLDGTAKGGVLVAAAEKFGMPIHAIGVGETLDDFRPFDPDEVAGLIAGARDTVK
jgi:fused signal recognition particle receptor